MVKLYKPRPQQANILNCAMAHIKSVSYKVTTRWLFYRLLQDGFYHDKADYKSFLKLQAGARKKFFGEWAPDTLADDTREFVSRGHGYSSVNHWLDDLKYESYTEDKWMSQPYYLEVWFEAAAMSSQFRYYLPDIPLFAFHGDCSIAGKWDAAKRLEEAAELYEKPIVVIYFGDDDPKGQQIPENAVKDIQDWCSVDFTFTRAGLNPGDGRRLGIPESIDKPGAYQWEALDDFQAGQLITDAVFSYYDREALQAVRVKETRVSHGFSRRMRDLTWVFELPDLKSDDLRQWLKMVRALLDREDGV